MFTNPLTRFRREATDIHREVRERVFVAVLRPGVAPAHRRRDAERVVTQARRELERLRERMSDGADRMAEEARAELFNLARMGAAHVQRDMLAEHTAWTAAQEVAAEVPDEAAAAHLIRHGLAQAGRDPHRAIIAGAVALRAYREEWTDALAAFLDSSRGRHRGGWGALEELRTWENIAAGTFPEWASKEVADAEEIAGASWPSNGRTKRRTPAA